MDDNYSLVLQRLREERERRKLTQQRLCTYMRIHQSNFSKAETGHRRFSYPEVKRLCSSDIDVFYIFTGHKPRSRWEFPELSEIGPEELICHLSTLYVQARTVRSLNRDKASFETIRKQLEYVQCDTGNKGAINSIFCSIRNRYDYTQKKMADILGMDIKTLQALEKGRKLPDSEIIWKMYDRFQVSPAFLLNDPRGLWNELNCMLDLLEDNDRRLMMQILENVHRFIRQCRCVEGEE